MPTPRSLRELTMPFSHLVFQYALLKLVRGVQGLGGTSYWATVPLYGPAINFSLLQIPVRLALLCTRHKDLHWIIASFSFPLTMNIFLMATTAILWSEPWWWNDTSQQSRKARKHRSRSIHWTTESNSAEALTLSRLPDIWANSLSNFELSFLLPENFLSNPSSFSLNLSLKALIHYLLSDNFH